MWDNAADMVRRLIAGGIDDEVRTWLMFGFKKWLADDGTLGLERYLGLPRKPQSVRRMIRNYWLRQAAGYFKGNATVRARHLQAAVLRFRCGPWAGWRGSSLPPPTANPAQGMLFFAMQAGAEMPSSTRQYMRILDDTTVNSNVMPMGIGLNDFIHKEPRHERHESI